MKIVVLTDVHGNLPALTVVLKAIARTGYDFVVHLGDAIGIGPYPAECLHTLLDVPTMRCVMGNHDAWFANGLPDPQPAWMGSGERVHHQWVHEQIDPALRVTVAQWPYRLQVEVETYTLAFLHYGLDESGREFVPIKQNPTSAELDALFSNVQADFIFYGHHHPFSDKQGKSRYVNPGALGCQRAPVARYTVISGRRDGLTIEHHSVPYSDHQLFAAFETRQVPEREFLYQAFFGDRFWGANAT